MRRRHTFLRSLTPDITIPWIGSSGAETFATVVEERLVSREGMSIDRQLQHLSDTVHFYPDYEHAIVRGQHPDGLYLLFNASQNLPAGKRHADDLSFILFRDGRLWITEGGHQSYELTGMTRYLRSPFAHNTYTLGSDYIEAEASPELRTFLRSMAVTPDYVEIVGFTERFETPASVERIIRVGSDFAELTIVDRLTQRNGSGAWTGRLHLPPDLKVEVSGEELIATDAETGQQMRVFLQGPGLAGFERHSGERDPIRGWGTWNGELGPVTTIEYTVDGSSEIVMEFSWEQ